MTISYNWLNDYLPEIIAPEKLSKILTSIGLEVESLEKYESIKGGLKGLIIGEVLSCEQHPNADKLKVTTVNAGSGTPLQIVCGAQNVAKGQKVIVATVGTTIYPTTGEPITMKVAKIRGVESFGMICAEDEIGLGTSHEGILVLPASVTVGTPASEYFKPYEDWTFEIGLTPNRMDAMSHLGVARDVCAYLAQHEKKDAKVKSPFTNSFKPDNKKKTIAVTIENTEACERYSGVSISKVEVKQSPQWLKDRLASIGIRAINNIVDVTNFILHETGQPLHAFDADAITNKHVIVKTLPQGSTFTTLDEKERTLSSEDLMICNEQEGMCIAGVFGGLESSVKPTTTEIFLESAWFNPQRIRKTSVRHNLRTEAAARFEKGVDISNTANVLKRAALLIKEVAGGEISSEVVDVYPNPKEKVQVGLKYHYLKKLSGKNYHPDSIKKILVSLGFEIVKEGMDELRVAVPYSKPDISLPADIVEEIVRIDGLDNIEIPTTITISPAIGTLGIKDDLKEKISGYLTGLGFHEIMTNSITNSKYFSDEVKTHAVKMINNLSADLDVMRPGMLETGLEVISYNINRKNNSLRLFEFGKTYFEKGVGDYKEEEHLALYITGNASEKSWNQTENKADFYYAKGMAASILKYCGIERISIEKAGDEHELKIHVVAEKQTLCSVSSVGAETLNKFDIKQDVYFIDFNFLLLLQLVEKRKVEYKEIAKYPTVERDIALVIDKDVQFEKVEQIVKKERLSKLLDMRLFDIFESDKLGSNKKSVAVNFTFLDEEKTLTDKEVDSMVNKLIAGFERDLGAEIRK